MNERWVAALHDWAVWCRAGETAESTIALRRHYLARFAGAAAHPDPWAVGLPELVRWLGEPAWSVETRRSARAALRSFYSWAKAFDHVEADPAARLPRIRVPVGAPRPAPTDVYRDALAGADDRTRLVLLLAALAGLRCAEIASLRWRDVQDGRLHVTGKGGRQRVIPVHPLLGTELAAELVRRLAGRFGTGWRWGSADLLVFVFPSQRPGQSYTAGHVGKIAKRAMGGGDWSCHTLRHRFACRAYAAERDLLAVQELLGHSKPETTRRYVQVPPGALDRAVLATG